LKHDEVQSLICAEISWNSACHHHGRVQAGHPGARNSLRLRVLPWMAVSSTAHDETCATLNIGADWACRRRCGHSVAGLQLDGHWHNRTRDTGPSVATALQPMSSAQPGAGSTAPLDRGVRGSSIPGGGRGDDPRNCRLTITLPRIEASRRPARRAADPEKH
jgi:hypothetical protein